MRRIIMRLLGYRHIDNGAIKRGSGWLRIGRCWMKRSRGRLHIVMEEVAK